MTSRDYLVRATRPGAMLDRKAHLGLSPVMGGDAAIVARVEEIAGVLSEDQPVLFALANVFGRAMTQGINLAAIRRDDPARGAAMIAELADEIHLEAVRALTAGAEGLLYALVGARGGLSTPQEYAEYYLPHDRRLLVQTAEAPLNTVLLVGGDDAFIDLAAELPCDLFGWDAEASGFDAAYVRSLRRGRPESGESVEGGLISSDPASEAILVHDRSLSALFEPSRPPEYVPAFAF